jgi:hypothetical protein
MRIGGCVSHRSRGPTAQPSPQTAVHMYTARSRISRLSHPCSPAERPPTRSQPAGAAAHPAQTDVQCACMLHGLQGDPMSPKSEFGWPITRYQCDGGGDASLRVLHGLLHGRPTYSATTIQRVSPHSHRTTRLARAPPLRTPSQRPTLFCGPMSAVPMH